MSWSVSVYSSLVSEVGWDDSTSEIVITWAKSGRKSAYAGGDEALALELSKAPSVGQMVNDQIKPNLSHRYLT